MRVKYFDNLRKYFCSKRCFIGSESRAISRQQTIRQPDNSDNNGRWHFLGIIDRNSDDDHDHDGRHDNDHDLTALESSIILLLFVEMNGEVDILRTGVGLG